MRRSLIALVGLALAGAAAAEELTIVSKRTKDGKDDGTSTNYIGTDHVRMTESDGQEFMVDLKTSTLTMIDGKKRQYSVVTKQDLQAAQVQIAARMKEMEAQTKNMPPAIQEKMKAMMGGMAAQVEVKKLGTSRSVAGLACDDWRITLGSISTTDQCVSSAVPFPQQSWEGYREFSQSLQQMMGAAGRGMSEGLQELQAKFKDMQGIPLASKTTISVLGRTTVTTTEVSEIRKGAIPASAWEIPAGYKKVDSPMLKGLAAK